MKTFINSAFILLCLCITNAAIARDNTKEDLLRADYLYRNLAFHEAIMYYERVASLRDDPAVMTKLADCYRFTRNLQSAAAWYAKAVKVPGCAPEVKLRYAQTLMNLMQYDEALPYLMEVQNTMSGDRRVANMITSCQQAAAMDQMIPLGSAMMVNFNTDGSEFGPTIRRGDLVFTADTVIGAGPAAKKDNWTGNSFYNIYKVTCDPMGSCNNWFDKIGKNINTKFHDGPSAFTADGNTMLFTRTNYEEKFLSRNSVPDPNGVVHLTIMMTTGYNEATQEFNNIAPFPYNSKDYSTAHPTIAPSGNVMVFSSDMPGGSGGTDLYMCRRNEMGGWSQPQNLGIMINTEGEEMFPFLYDDQTLYFSSNGLVGMGGLDIYGVKWDYSSNSFGTPENIGSPVNSSYDDMSLALYGDGKTGYFASARPDTRRGDNIYFVKLQSIYLRLTVIDGITGKPIGGAGVNINCPKDKRNLSTNSSGELLTQMFPMTQCAVEVVRTGYETQKIDINTSSDKDVDTIERTVSLNPIASIRYQAVVLDEKTKMPVEDPIIVFIESGVPDTAMLETGETYTRSLKPGTTYSVYAAKEGYYSNEKIVSTERMNFYTNTTIRDTLFLKKLAAGETYKIDNIYYDFDKANIREDAKPSLNRLLEILDDYPEMKIQLNSHADCRGDNNYNLKLTDRRAHSVITYLQERGIAKERLKWKGYGETMPVVPCPDCKKCSEEEHQQNRRTEFQIITMGE